MKTSGSLSNKKSMKSSVSIKKHKIAKKVTVRSFKRKGTKKLRKKKIRGGGDMEDRDHQDEILEKKKNKVRRRKLGKEGRKTEDSESDKVETEEYDKYVGMINQLNEKLKKFCGECPQGEERAVSNFGTNRLRGENPLENDLPEPKREEYNNFKAGTKGFFRSGKSMVEKKNEIKRLQNATVEELFGGVEGLVTSDENITTCDLFKKCLTNIFTKADYNYTASPTYHSGCSDEYSFYKIYRHYVDWLKNEIVETPKSEEERIAKRTKDRAEEEAGFLSETSTYVRPRNSM